MSAALGCSKASGLAAALAAALAAVAPCQAPCGPLHYGVATAGGGAVAPTIAAGGGPAVLGNAGLTIEVDGVPAGAPLVQLLGFARIAAPFAGVEVLVDASLVAPAIATSTGTSSYGLPIPDNTAPDCGMAKAFIDRPSRPGRRVGQTGLKRSSNP